MQIKDYHPKYAKEVTQLICDTIWAINCKDYTREQLVVWAENFKNFDSITKMIEEYLKTN